MKIIAIPLVLLLHVAAANAQNSPAEVVRFENVQVDGEVKTVYLGNANKHYVLFCNVKTDGCITPEEDKDYLLFNKDSRWMMPGATKFLTLAGMQEWTVTYNQGENIGLIAKDGSSGIGMFVLDKTGGGYEKDTINSDGPIIYGTHLGDKDRKKAWEHFVFMMVQACMQQQGQDVCGLKLARRCPPDQDRCTATIEANLVGIGGIQEPRRVVLMIATDKKDQNLQIVRMVCTWPIKERKVCRDWSTGKLILASDAGR